MQRRIGRASVVATILATLVLPAVTAPAGPEKALDHTEDELAGVRHRLAVRTAKADSLQDEIDVLNDEMLRVRSIVTRLDEEIADIESDVRSEQARIDETQVEIDKIEGAAVEQAVALYKGGTDTLDVLLSAESLSELDARLEMMGVAAEETTGALVKFGRLTAEIEAQKRALFVQLHKLDDKRDEQSKLLAESKKIHLRLAEKLYEQEAMIGDLEHEEGNLESKALALTSQIQAIQAKRAVTALGESAQGFIWPLNGPITSYYGERWGRMHTGIDIDGNTGDPVVASKAGRVIMASYYSGYGNAVIIDHGGGYATLYGHLSAFDVSNGETVSQGQIIGRVGCTGSCTGSHLHFEVRINGEPVDPLPYLP